MFLFLPQTIVNMRDIDSESDSPEHYLENGNDQNSPNNEAEDLLIHPDFRLWLTIQPEVGLPLPAVVIQHGLKLACEAQENFREAVQTNCQVAAGSLNNSVPLWGEAAEKSVFKVEYFSFLCRKKVSLYRYFGPSCKRFWCLQGLIWFNFLEWRSPVLDFWTGVSSFSSARKTEIRTECVQLPVSVVCLITFSLCNNLLLLDNSLENQTRGIHKTSNLVVCVVSSHDWNS